MATKMERELLNLETKYWQALRDNDVDAALELTDIECWNGLHREPELGPAMQP